MFPIKYLTVENFFYFCFVPAADTFKKSMSRRHLENARLFTPINAFSVTRKLIITYVIFYLEACRYSLNL